MSMDFSRLIRPYARKIMTLFSRGKMERLNSTDNTGKTGLLSKRLVNPQRLQMEGFKDEIITGIERAQEYGLETWPKSGTAEAFAAFINGNRDYGVVLCVSDVTYRPTDLTEGDVCLYDLSKGRVIIRDGKIAIGTTDVTKVMTSTPATGTVELLELIDRLLTVLQGTLNLGGMASMTTFLPSVITELSLIQADLNKIKGEL